MTSLGGRRRFWMLVCAALVALIAIPNFLAPLRPYDAGIASSSATFTLHGLLPYRDFWLLYGPLSGFILAVPTALAGPSVELNRLVGTGLMCVQAGVVFGIASAWVPTRPAMAIAIASVVMYPALLGLEVSSWMVALTLAFVGIWIAISNGRGGALVGVMVGFALLARLDLGAYGLLAALAFPDRRSTIAGFSMVAVPFALFILATTSVASLIEQLIWYPIVGPRQFRGLPGPDAVIAQPAAVLLSLPLVVLPRGAIVVAAAWLVLQQKLGTSVRDRRSIVSILAFATLCQLQTLGRADIEHYAQASTPALLLLAVPYREVRAGLPRFTVFAALVAMCLVVGLLSLKYVATERLSSEDQSVLIASAWIQAATDPEDPLFVGLTSNRYTVNNPLLIYYLAGRRSGVHDAMYNPGVTNTDWAQRRMVDDLERTQTEYLVLDRAHADLHEPFNESRIPGSTLLDTYIEANYQTVCDLVTLVILRRVGAGPAPTPACPQPIG
jgi:hypothetical protein